MQKINMLVLTDHRGHSSENSLYALLRTMRQHPGIAKLDVADLFKILSILKTNFR